MSQTPEEIATERIQKAVESDANELDLSELRLESLPHEISQIRSLTTLNLSYNKLVSLPPEISQFTGLTNLVIFNNNLASLPSEISQLTNLTKLVIRNNELTNFPLEIVQLTNLMWLDLGGVGSNQLASLPPEISQLQNLTRFDLSGNALKSLPPEIGQLQNLTTLVLSNNGLASLPPEIGQIQNLTTLDLSNNSLASLPPEIGQLQNLTSLNLSGNGLTSLPPEIGQLQNLTRLILRNNQLASLPPEIIQLQNLTQLDLSFNKLTSLPPEIIQLQNLTQLNLSGIGLTSLPPEIGKLQNLMRLELSDNDLKSLPSEIVQLQNLTRLDFSSNGLASLPSEIGQLTNLTSLSLTNNQFASLPPEIIQLINLTILYLNDNQLASLPPGIGQLQNLTRLDFRNNQLASLPKELIELVKLEKIFLHENPLAIAIPAELLGYINDGGDAQRIFDFYKKLWEEGGRPLGEARVLVVGQPQVGKSSLVERLVHGTYTPNRDSTITVEMHTLPSGENTALIWDFGGQEHMHSTHPFFFSDRCVYLLVINVRDTEEQNRLEYWLRTIALYGKDSPIILVGNKADKDQHTLDIPIKRLKKEYPNLRIAVETSAQDDMGIEELRVAIVKQVDSLPQVRVELPVSYLAIKEAMDAEKQRKNIISLEKFVELCEENNIKDKRDQDNLLALLHDLGTIFHFKDNDGQAISEVGILNPNWVTNGVYRVINSEQVRKETKGKLTMEMVHQILPSGEYAHHHCRLIVDLMKRFELCFQADETTFWLPNLMDKSEPDTGSWDSALTFEYEYPELPENVITRFIVRTHSWMYSNHVWRTGIHLEKDGNQALVRANMYTKRLTIQVNGRENTRRDLLSFLRGHFDEIHKPFDPKPKAYIYPKEYPDVQISFDDLLLYEGNRRDKITITAKGGVMDLSVRELLNGFIDLSERDKERRTRDGEMPDFTEKGSPKEIHYHEHKHIEVGENVSGSVFNLGNDSSIKQSVQNSFNGFPAETQKALVELMKLTEALLAKAEESEHKEELQDELIRLKNEADAAKPKAKIVKPIVERLADAARNLNEVGKPVLELATTVIKLINALP